jgi:hypothetical protein
MKNEGQFYRETEAEYQQHYTTHKSATSLKTFRKSPLIYRLECLGILASKRGSFFTFGSAFHCYLLESLQFTQRFTVSDPPINPRTGNPFGSETKAANEWRKSLTMEAVTSKEFSAIQQMANSIALTHPKIWEQIQQSTCELSWRGQLGGIPFQSRIDVLHDECVIDLKTVHDLDEFE